jgi:hypothetical protein
MNKDTALRLALEAMKKCQSALAEELSVWDIDPPLHHILESHNLCGPAIAACEAALEAKDKPVQNQLMALIDENQRLRAELKFNTAPPQRTWVGLTNEEINKIIGSDRYSELLKAVVQTVQAKLKEKNT